MHSRAHAACPDAYQFLTELCSRSFHGCCSFRLSLVAKTGCSGGRRERSQVGSWRDSKHIWASLQLAAGENIAVVQRQLGHASPLVTLTIYRHLLPLEGKGLNGRLATMVREAKNAPDGDKVVAIDAPEK